MVTLQLGPCQPGRDYSPLSRLPTFLSIYWYLCMWGLKLAPADKHAVLTRHSQAHPPRRAAVYGSICLGCLTGPRMLCVRCNEWLIAFYAKMGPTMLEIMLTNNTDSCNLIGQIVSQATVLQRVWLVRLSDDLLQNSNSRDVCRCIDHVHDVR